MDTYDNNLTTPQKNFYFKTLNASHAVLIEKFLNNNHNYDELCKLKQIYATDYIYWLLRQIPPGMCISIMCAKTNKLIGILCATSINIFIKDEKYSCAIINILCIHTKLRKFDYEAILISELKKVLREKKLDGMIHPILHFDSEPNALLITDSNQIIADTYAIPINIEKFSKIGFVKKDFMSGYSFDSETRSSFKIASKNDILNLAPKLNQSLSAYDVRQNFDESIILKMFFPRKNIVYTYVKKNQDGEITDFISLTKSQIYSTKEKITMNNANISYYFVTTMTLTDMFVSIIPSLLTNGFDQIIIKDIAKGGIINITKFVTTSLYNIKFLTNNLNNQTIKLQNNNFFIDFYG